MYSFVDQLPVRAEPKPKPKPDPKRRARRIEMKLGYTFSMKSTASLTHSISCASLSEMTTWSQTALFSRGVGRGRGAGTLNGMTITV